MKKNENGKYVIDVRLKLGGRLRMVAYTDIRASRKLEENIKSLDACLTAGERPDRELSNWLDRLPISIKTRLAKYNLISKEKFEASRRLENHLQDYKESMRAKGRNARHIRQEITKIRKMTNWCNFNFICDINSDTLHKQLYSQTIDYGMGARTANSYGTAFKSFINWLVIVNRVNTNPLNNLPRFKENIDIRHERRALTVDELTRLLESALSGDVWRGMSGYERYLLYLTAMETGIRWSELRSLRRDSLDFSGTTSRITLEAGYTKNGKTEVLPIKDELAEELQNYFTANLALPNTLLFPNMPKGTVGAKMIRFDLKNTGTSECQEIPYQDEAGRIADFHALRHSFITGLANSGVHPSTAQRLARHSTIELTMNRYTHSSLENQYEAVEKLPELKISSAISGKKEGTNDEESESYLEYKSRWPENVQNLPKQADYRDNHTNRFGELKSAPQNLRKTENTVYNKKNPIVTEVTIGHTLGRETEFESATFRATI